MNEDFNYPADKPIGLAKAVKDLVEAQVKFRIGISVTIENPL